jgi:bacterioferritin-associated ferredoxin
MIICVCNAVCDRRLRGLAADGVRTLEQIEAACGAGGDCGTCHTDIERIVAETALVRTVRPLTCAPASDDAAMRPAAIRSAA